MRLARAGLVAMTIIAAAPITWAQPGPRTFLFYIDDLHIDFRNTPRLRAVVTRLGRELARDGDMWAMVTPGHSSISIRPNADWNGVSAETRRLTAGGLRPAQRQPEEAAFRARLAASTAVAVIREAAADGRSLVVLYFSSGYLRAVSPELTAVTELAAQVKAPIFVVDLRRPADSPASGTTPADWNAYVAETQDALRTLATATGGFTAFTDADLEQMLTRIRGAG